MRTGELYLCQLSSTLGQNLQAPARRPAAASRCPRRSRATGAFSATRDAHAEQQAHSVWAQSAVLERPRGEVALGRDPEHGERRLHARRANGRGRRVRVFVKHFELPVDDTNPAIRKRLETRLLVKMATGATLRRDLQMARRQLRRRSARQRDHRKHSDRDRARRARSPAQDIGGPTLAGSTSRTGRCPHDPGGRHRHLGQCRSVPLRAPAAHRRLRHLGARGIAHPGRSLHQGRPDGARIARRGQPPRFRDGLPEQRRAEQQQRRLRISIPHRDRRHARPRSIQQCRSRS